MIKIVKGQQPQCFTASSPIRVNSYVELALCDNCDIYNVFDLPLYLEASIENLAKEIEGKFIQDEKELRDQIDVIIPSLAEFAVLDLVTNILRQFEREYVQSGRQFQWFSKASPSLIDIYALRQTENGWRFYVIEVKWSRQCNYNRQIRQGLVDDLKKLYESQYAYNRLGQHVTCLKTVLRPRIGDIGIETLFSMIEVGESPSETKGVEFWGVFVSDWSLNIDSDPNEHFAKLANEAERNGWPKGTVKGLMLNIPDGENVMSSLALGRKLSL